LSVVLGRDAQKFGNTLEDLDDFTEEKMRGDAYIRMLCKPVKCSDVTRHVTVGYSLTFAYISAGEQRRYG
jgi:hypothetical protein